MKMISAYVLGKVEPNQEKKVVSGLKSIKGIKKAEITFGQYDFVAEVEAKDEIELKSILVDKVRLVSGIAATMTLIANNGRSA